MKRMSTLIAALAFAAGAQAQINHPHNEIGIYTVEDPDGCATAQIDVPTIQPFTCYLVLTNPYNEDLGQPVSTVGGAEFSLVLPPDLYLLGAYYPVPQTGWPEPPDFYYGTQAPVVDNHCTMLIISMMAASDGPLFAYLSPLQYTPQTIAGDIVFTDYDDEFSVHVMYPVSGSFDVPVFAVNWDGGLSFCETVPSQGMAFGTVKALYR